MHKQTTVMGFNCLNRRVWWELFGWFLTKLVLSNDLKLIVFTEKTCSSTKWLAKYTFVKKKRAKVVIHLFVYTFQSSISSARWIILCTVSDLWDP